MYFNLEDLLNISKNNGNNNPGIFILSDSKSINKSEEAFPPSNIIMDKEGDIIILVNEEMFQN